MKLDLSVPGEGPTKYQADPGAPDRGYGTGKKNSSFPVREHTPITDCAQPGDLAWSTFVGEGTRRPGRRRPAAKETIRICTVVPPGPVDHRGW